MDWIKDFDLFLFDFDGLLVDTEKLHFAAFRQMCRERGWALDWDMDRYEKEAHQTSQGLKDATYREFPPLLEQEPDWDRFYARKKKIYEEILRVEKIDLLPGVSELLEALKKAEKRRCVVTNSTKEHVDIVRKRIPILDSIPLWVTREDYRDAKPSPEGYLKAISLVGKSGDRIIGFEDSVRGLKALLAAKVKAVAVCSKDPCLENVLYFPSLNIIDFH
jgi:beta-phosphoglucomutase